MLSLPTALIKYALPAHLEEEVESHDDIPPLPFSDRYSHPISSSPVIENKIKKMDSRDGRLALLRQRFAGVEAGVSSTSASTSTGGTTSTSSNSSSARTRPPRDSEIAAPSLEAFLERTSSDPWIQHHKVPQYWRILFFEAVVQLQRRGGSADLSSNMDERQATRQRAQVECAGEQERPWYSVLSDWTTGLFGGDASSSSSSLAAGNPLTRPAKDEEPSFAAFAAAVFALLDERDDDKMRNLVVNDVFKGVTEAVCGLVAVCMVLGLGEGASAPGDVGIGIGNANADALAMIVEQELFPVGGDASPSSFPWVLLLRPFLCRLFLGRTRYFSEAAGGARRADEDEEPEPLLLADFARTRYQNDQGKQAAAQEQVPSTFNSLLLPLRLRLLRSVGAACSLKLLFSTRRDGASWNKCAQTLDSYGKTPVLLLCRRREEGDFFGAYVSCGFADHGGAKYVEDSTGVDSFLFGLRPDSTSGINAGEKQRRRASWIVRCVKSSKRYSSNFSYLNAGKNPYNPIGLGVGGQGGEMSRFYLTKDFCGHFLQTDSVFEPGHVVLAGQEEDAVDAHDAAPAALPLLVETKFQYEFEGAVELFVFGLGGREAEEEMQRQKDSLAKMKDASRKVDRRRFADNSFDREFLLGNTFAATSSDAARAAVEERRNEKT